MGSLSFPFQRSTIRVRPQHIAPPGPILLVRLPPTSVHLPPSLPGSCFAPRAWLVSIRAWVPLSSGKAFFPNFGHRGPKWMGKGNRGPDGLLPQPACVLPRIFKLSLCFIFCPEWLPGRLPLGPFSSDQTHMNIGCSVHQRHLECTVYKGLWIFYK